MEEEQAQSSPNPSSITVDQINKSITWYRSHKQSITGSLPLDTPGVRFGLSWPEKTLEVHIERWESRADDRPLKLAASYILFPLRTIRAALKEAEK